VQLRRFRAIATFAVAFTMNPSFRPGSKGFTLIELMVTVAIVAVLAGIGYPAYAEHVKRGRVVDATGELATMRVRLEQYYQDNRNYGSTATACGVAVPANTSFTFTCSWGAGGTSQGFLVTATGNASAGMSGYAFTVDQGNAQVTTAYPGATGLPRSCWLKRKGDTC
jgi:type IV pilus assembly protein PilE